MYKIFQRDGKGRLVSINMHIEQIYAEGVWNTPQMGQFFAFQHYGDTYAWVLELLDRDKHLGKMKVSFEIWEVETRGEPYLEPFLVLDLWKTLLPKIDARRFWEQHVYEQAPRYLGKFSFVPVPWGTVLIPDCFLKRRVIAYHLDDQAVRVTHHTHTEHEEEDA